MHYRGLLIVALLAVGNLFCFGCPFVLVRDAGSPVSCAETAVAAAPSHQVDWHRTPRRGALYLRTVRFVGAATQHGSARPGVFRRRAGHRSRVRRGTFCKYICPIGQFNFTASTVSPLELRINDLATCRSCRTADCIKGRPPAPSGRVALRGCELGLFLPMKVGNLDCTFCLDCVHACPHDNIAIATRVPGAELTETRRRSGVGRLARRSDIAALVVVFVFGALMNAFGMVSPVYELEQWLSSGIGRMAGASSAPEWVDALDPVCRSIGYRARRAVVRRRVAHSAACRQYRTESIGRTAVNYTFALVPFGFGMWLAHYGFHLLTGALTVVPVVRVPRSTSSGGRFWGSVLAMGRNAARRRLSDSAWAHPSGCVGIVDAGLSDIRAGLSGAASRRNHPVGDRDNNLGGRGSVDSVAADGDARGRLDRMKRKTSLVVIACATIVAAVGHAATVDAHSGPPFPVISNQIAGPYEVSVWTDPDATADGSAAGQFWVVVQPANRATSLPADTKVNVTIQPADGGPALRGTAKPVNGDDLETVRGAADGSRRSLCGSSVD